MKMYFVPLEPEETSEEIGDAYVMQVMQATLAALEREGEITSVQHQSALERLSKSRG